MDYGTIIYVRRGIAPQRLTLRLGSIAIGSDASNDLVLDDASVGRFHARIICTATGCTLIDLGSPGGTLVGSTRLQASSPTLLHDEDRVRIGPFGLVYKAPQPAAPLEALRENPPATMAPPQPVAAPAGTPLHPDVARSLPTGSSRSPARSSTPTPVATLPNNRGPGRIPPGSRLLHGPSAYLRFLPECYQWDPFLGEFLLIFESILDPIERGVDLLPYYFDPHLVPETLLPWLASWLDLARHESWPLERRRELLSNAAELYRWRGTRRGLRRYLQIYCGVEPTIVEHDPAKSSEPDALPAHAFRVILAVPDPNALDRSLVEQIIAAEKPAHSGFELVIRHQRTG